MITGHNKDIGLAFYNDRVKEIMDAGIMAEPFTYIPPLAGHMELVGGNALVFGKITEGYDSVAIDVDVEKSYEDVASLGARVNLAVKSLQLGVTSTVHYPAGWNPSVEYHKGDVVLASVGYAYTALRTTTGEDPFSSPSAWFVIVFWDTSITYRMIIGVLNITIPLVINENSIYYITVYNTEEGILPLTASYIAQPGDTYVEVKAGLQASLLLVTTAGEIETGSPANEIFLYGRTRYYKNSPYEAGDVWTIFKNFIVHAYYLTLGYSIKFSQLKCGAVHSFGLVYKDRAGRVCSVTKTLALSVYIPFYAEDEDFSINSIIKLLFKINHTPPEWAESYEIVYYGNVSMDYFLQIRADDITSLGNNRYSVGIQSTLDWTRNQNNRWKVADYSWEHGDRLRLVGTINELTGDMTKLYSGEAIGGEFIPSAYDYEIEATGTQYDEQAIGGDWLIIQAVDHPTPFVGQTNIIVEAYRPRKGFGNTLAIAYGTGMVFDIGIDSYGHKYHKGDVDQVLDASGANSTPAEVYNYDTEGQSKANDCWKFSRLNYKHNDPQIFEFWAESIFPSDWWADQTLSSKLTSQGFPFLEDLSQKQTILPERFRFGGALIEGTRTNNIAHFIYLNFRDLQRKNGEITGMRETGYTLNVVQMYKETSVYINRRQTFNPDGTSQFVLTDSFIGDMRPLDTDYGCQHPDSITVNGRNLYYWDNSQGRFIRSAPNGQLALDIKMKRWFDDLKKWIAANGGASVLQTRTGINNDHDEIWMTFRMGDEIQGLIFSEKKGRYVAEINQITESYVHIGNFFAHLYQQRLWIMNIDEGQDFLSWGGTPTYAEIEVVSNVDSLKNKIFNAVAIFTDHLLQSLARTVVIPAEASGSNELMESNIPVFERKEGVYYGKIMKDENSKGNFLTVLARKLNGRQMRGRYAFLKFRTTEHSEKVRIDSIVIFSTPSERNI